MIWLPDALRSLKKDVPFFVRPAVRRKVEAMASAAGENEVTLAFYLMAKSSMAPK